MDSRSNEILVDDDPELRELLTTFLADQTRRATANRIGASNRAGRPLSDVLVIDITSMRQGGSPRCRVMHPRSDLSALILEAVDADEGSGQRGRHDAAAWNAATLSTRQLFAKVADERRSYGYLTPSTNVPGRTARFGGWTLDIGRHRLSAKGGVTVSLSPTESALLLAFLDRPREVLTRAWLIEASRAKSRPFSTRTLDVYVSRLRRRLSIRAGGAELIATRQGQGYVFDADVVFE